MKKRLLCYCSAHVSDRPDSSIGVRRPRLATVGKYRIGELIGRGATGTVYRAYSPAGEAVAVKVALSTEERDCERFAREAEIRIEHDNVIRVIHAGVHDTGHHYIVQELLAGRPMSHVLRAGPMPAARVTDVGIQVCAGLVAIHAHGIIHRDLKPGNLFFCDNGQIKILDFGAALTRASATHFIAEGDIVGTPAYLSPEQAQGNIDIDNRVDIWALGAILYHALTGASPFDRGDMLATLLAVVMDSPMPLALAQPSVPAALSSVIERALCRDRDGRLLSATAFQRALMEAGEEVNAGTQQVSEVARIDEQRVIALVLASGLRDGALLDQEVCKRGGQFIRLPDSRADEHGPGRALGVFGAHVWEGDEVRRAAGAALASRGAASVLAVTSGYATLGQQRVTGALLQTAESGCRLGLAGVAVDRVTGESAREAFALRVVDEHFLEITGVSAFGDATPAYADERQQDTVGRSAEFARVQIALETAIEDELASVVLVHGSLGIGKSQMCADTIRDVARHIRPITVLSGQARPLSRGSDYALLLSAVRGRLAVGAAREQWPDFSADMTPAERRRVLTLFAAEALPDTERAARCASFLGTLFGIAATDDPHLLVARQQPRLLADRIRMAWHEYFDGLVRQGPVALFLEDVQWMDEASRELLSDMLAGMAERPLFIFATMRTDQSSAARELWPSRDVEYVHLRGLVRDDARILAESLAERPLGTEVLDQILERAVGNPLFIEHIVAGLREYCDADTQPVELPIPHTVDAAVQSRLDRLSPAEKELCKRAAVWGRPFTPAELHAIGISRPEPLLASLERRGILRTERFTSTRRTVGTFEQTLIRFKSLLVSDVAYRLNAESMRVELHRRVAEYLSEKEPIDNCEEIAQHFEHGGSLAQAGPFYARAASVSMARSDTAAAERCAERALAAGVSSEMHFALHMIRADAVRFLERRDYQTEALDSALAAAKSPAERARASTEKAYLRQRLGDSQQGLVLIERAVSEARAAEDSDLLIDALGWRAVILARMGHHDSAASSLSAARSVTREPTPLQRSRFAEWRAQIAARRGDLGERERALRDAVQSYAEIGDFRRLVGAEINLADLYNRLGAFAEAERALRAALEGNKRMHNPLMSGYALANMGYALFMQGRCDEALAALAKSAELAASMCEAQLELCVRIYRCYGLVTVAAEPVNSQQLAEQATAAALAAEELKLPSLLCLALAVAARAHLGAGNDERALELSSQSMVIRAQLGGIEEDEGQVFLAHVLALTACGQLDRAEDVRRHARRRIQEIAAGIDEPSTRAVFLRAIPAHRALLGGA